MWLPETFGTSDGGQPNTCTTNKELTNGKGKLNSLLHYVLLFFRRQAEIYKNRDAAKSSTTYREGPVFSIVDWEQYKIKTVEIYLKWKENTS